MTRKDDEGRRSPRVTHVALAWCESVDGVRYEGLARVVDLSATGVGLILQSPMSSSTKVTVELLLLERLRLRGEGEVVYCRRTGQGERVGIRFAEAPRLVDDESGAKANKESVWPT